MFYESSVIIRAKLSRASQVRDATYLGRRAEGEEGGGGGGDRSRVSTGAEREQIAFQPCCSLPIHNADRKPVDNGGPVEESSALVAIKLLFGHPLCLLFPPPRSPPPVAAVPRSTYPGHLNYQTGRSHRAIQSRVREKQREGEREPLLLLSSSSSSYSHFVSPLATPPLRPPYPTRIISHLSNMQAQAPASFATALDSYRELSAKRRSLPPSRFCHA